MSRMIERFVTDLPDPDSPTMPSVSPRSRSKLTPLTALTTPSSPKKCVSRSCTDSRTSPAPLVEFALMYLSCKSPIPVRFPQIPHMGGEVRPDRLHDRLR